MTCPQLAGASRNSEPCRNAAPVAAVSVDAAPVDEAMLNVEYKPASRMKARLAGSQA